MILPFVDDRDYSEVIGSDLGGKIFSSRKRKSTTLFLKYRVGPQKPSFSREDLTNTEPCVEGI